MTGSASCGLLKRKSAAWVPMGGRGCESDPASGFGRRRTAKPDELEAYVATPAAGPDAGVLQRRKADATAHPCLATMARGYLAIPATGAPAERVFSGGATLVQPGRESLSEDSVRACMCLKRWLKLAR